MSTYLVAGLVALAVSAALTPVSMAAARRWGWLDRPGPRKIHAEPTPVLGGAAVLAGLVAGLAAAAVTTGLGGGELRRLGAVLAGGFMLQAVGMADDQGLLHHQVKLQVAMPLAGLFLLAVGVRATLFEGGATLSLPVMALLEGLPATTPALAGRIADAAVTLLWTTGLIASFSILDHMDGLCAGVSIVAAVSFFAVGTVAEAPSGVVMLAAATAGAAAGFLPWNFRPAKTFLGDGGALLMGFLAAALSLRVEATAGPAPWAPLAPLLVLVVPLFDTALVMISRWRRGLVPYRSPGKDHMAHRMAEAGIAQRTTVFGLWLLGIAGGMLGWLSTGISTSVGAWLTAAVALAVSFAGVAAFEWGSGQGEKEATASGETRAEPDEKADAPDTSRPEGSRA